MNYKYFPHTPEDIKEMLSVCGVDSLDGLYADIPDSVKFHGDYDLPSEKSELEVRAFFDKIGKEDKQLTCFAGAGATTTTLLPPYRSSSSALNSSPRTLLIKLKYRKARSSTSSNTSR